MPLPPPGFCAMSFGLGGVRFSLAALGAAAAPVAAGAAVVAGALVLAAGLDVAAGAVAAGALVAAGLVVAAGVAGAAVAAGAALPADLSTPLCPRQAPRPALLVVPSLHVTISSDAAAAVVAALLSFASAPVFVSLASLLVSNHSLTP